MSFLRLICACIYLSVLASAAAWAAQPQAITLKDKAAAIDAKFSGFAWVDTTGKMDISQISEKALSGALGSAQATNTTYRLEGDGALWLHYRIYPIPGSRQEWLIEVPMPMIDSVTLYQASAGGGWQAQTAGDTVAQSQWPQPGRYPHFYLNTESGQTRDYFLRIQHATPFSMPVRLVSDQQYHQNSELKSLLFGLALGVLLLMCIICLAQYWLYRNLDYAWYAVYSLLVACAIAGYSGLAALYLWPESGWWSDTSRGFYALLSVSVAMLLVRRVTRIERYSRFLNAWMHWFACFGFLLTLTFVMVPRQYGAYMLGIYVPVAALAMMTASGWVWHKRERAGAWLVAAHAPLMAATLLTLAVYYGWILGSGFIHYAAVGAILLEAPFMLVALNLQSRERDSALMRSQEGNLFDALTGVSAAKQFQLRLHHVVNTFKIDPGQGAAVAYFDLINYERIKLSQGFAIAEESLLRSVNLLSGLLNPRDTISRIGSARFGVIFYGVKNRAALSETAVRVIADGLIEREGEDKNVSLHFHVAAVVLSEISLEADEVNAALTKLLESMRPSTHRQLRFLGLNSQPIPIHPNPS
jgi:two-component system, sensor histidine kinase LadS